MYIVYVFETSRENSITNSLNVHCKKNHVQRKMENWKTHFMKCTRITVIDRVVTQLFKKTIFMQFFISNVLLFFKQ